MVAEKIVYTNSLGRSITATNRLPFLLQSVEGKGDINASVQLQSSPYQDGATYIDSVLESRSLQLIINIKANDRDSLNELKAEISSVFNPKLKQGKMEYFNGNVHVENELVVNSVSFPSGDAKGKWYQRVLIDLTAPNPHWKSPITQVEPLAAFVPLFEFPFESEFEIGVEGHETIINNNSDIHVPIEIYIKGPTVNPCLTNLTTGERIKVNRELLSDDVLYINTEDGNKQVLLNGQDVFGYIDLSSTFFKLTFGDNTLKYTADSGTDTATLEIKLQERYNVV